MDIVDFNHDGVCEDDDINNNFNSGIPVHQMMSLATLPRPQDQTHTGLKGQRCQLSPSLFIYFFLRSALSSFSFLFFYFTGLSLVRLIMRKTYALLERN